MSKKLLFLISLVLTATLVPTIYGSTVIGNWEDVNDGWDIWPDPNVTVTMEYNDTNGVTLDNNSLTLTVSENNEAGGYTEVLYLKLQDDANLVDAFFDYDIFTVDVTRLASEWTGGGSWSGIDLIVNANSVLGEVYMSLTSGIGTGGLLYWSPGDGNEPKTASWNYSLLHDGINDGNDSNNPEIDPCTIDWLEFIIATNYDDTNYTKGIYYLDNALLSPGPPALPVVGDWEEVMDGWALWGGAPATLDYNTTGATLHDFSLQVTNPPGWEFAIVNALHTNNLVDAFFLSDTFTIDITRIASEWQGTGQWSGLVLIINSGPDSIPTSGWHDQGSDNSWWSSTEGDKTLTATWDYSAEKQALAPYKDQLGWLEFIFATNTGGYTTIGSYYLDNAQFPGLYAASNPNPEDGATDVPRPVTLSWSAGVEADLHDIYFGTSEDAVNDANRNDPEYEGNQPASNCSYVLPPLEGGTTYYWRIDEVNDPTTWKGKVWQFTTSIYSVVENFNSYSGLDDVWHKTPGILGADIDIYGDDAGEDDVNLIRDGNSLVYYYGFDYPSAEIYADTCDLPSGIGSDWTIEGVKVLTLWFRGQADNAATPMYVKLVDAEDNNATVYYDDANDVNKEKWHKWDIDLREFAGVDRNDVNIIAIGFYPEDIEDYDTVYFEDILLSPPQCILSERDPNLALADFAPYDYFSAGDCKVDHQELEIMARDWLAEDDVVDTCDPGTAGLEAYYSLDEGAGTEANDPCGHDGTLATGVTWVSPGIIGSSAIHMNGGDGQRISIGDWNPVGPNGLTLALWVKWAGPTGESQGLISKRDGWGDPNKLMFMFEVDTGGGGNGVIQFRQYTDAGTDVSTAPGVMLPFIGTWAHLAATFYNGNTITIYLNGSAVANGPFTMGTKTDAGMAIGNTNSETGWPNCPEAFNGDIDEVYIYDHAMYTEEIAYLADLTHDANNEHHVPVPSPAEIYEGEAEGDRAVNFKDFAIVAAWWLEEDFYP